MDRRGRRLVHYLAKPKDYPDESVQGQLKYIRRRMVRTDSQDPLARTKVFNVGRGNNLYLSLQALNINNDENPVGPHRGQKVITLLLTRKPSIKVYFRQSLSEDSLPYILVKYGDKERYKFQPNESEGNF